MKKTKKRNDYLKVIILIIIFPLFVTLSFLCFKKSNRFFKSSSRRTKNFFFRAEKNGGQHWHNIHKGYSLKRKNRTCVRLILVLNAQFWHNIMIICIKPFFITFNIILRFKLILILLIIFLRKDKKL